MRHFSELRCFLQCLDVAQQWVLLIELRLCQFQFLDHCLYDLVHFFQFIEADSDTQVSQ